MTDAYDPREFIFWFRQCAPYIHAHRGRCFVILVSGEDLDGPGFQTLMHDIALLSVLGAKVVLVYGARPQIEALVDEQGGDSLYVDGLRVTDTLNLEAVKEAVGRLRVEIEALLSMGVTGSPMGGAKIRVASGTFITAKPLGVLNGQDFGHTGEVRRVDAQGIRARLDAGDIVLLPPLGYSPTGEIFNLSAEDTAVSAATALRADKLMILVDSKTQTDHSFLTPSEAENWLREHHPPMDTAASVAAAVQACRNGVRRAHLVSRDNPGTLLRELYTRDGAGLLITEEHYEDIREARVEDVGDILELIAPLEAGGILVGRSSEQIERTITDFMVIDRDGLIVGCAALHPLANSDMGELACLATHPQYRNAGRGDALLDHVERRARDGGLKHVIVLTTQTAHWFRERGFEPGKMQDLPMERQATVNDQRNAKVFVKALAL